MARNINFFDGAQSATTPTIGNIDASSLNSYANDAAYEAAEVGAPAGGNIYYNTTTDQIRMYDAGEAAWKDLVEADVTALSVTYDNTSSGLTAITSQAAHDEVEARVDTNETDISTAQGDITTAQGDITNLETLSGVAGATDNGTFTGTTIPDTSDTKAALQSLETEVETKVATSLIGANNGVASLDGGGKVPAAQLPTSLMEYQGDWNATTNTPTLADTDTLAQGNVYRVSVAGTVDFGAGNITFAVGDWVYNNGTVWGLSVETTLPDTDSLPEGAANLYYTEARVDANSTVTGKADNDLNNLVAPQVNVSLEP